MLPNQIPNWIGTQELSTQTNEWFDKINPANGQALFKVARSRQADIQQAIELAKKAQPTWADTPAVQRGMILHKIVMGMQNRQSEIAAIVAAETGKSMKEALGETGGAIQCGLFYASEIKPIHKIGKKLVAARDLKAGHALTCEDIAIKSPKDGTSPCDLDIVVSKTLKNDLYENQNIRFEELV